MFSGSDLVIESNDKLKGNLYVGGYGALQGFEKQNVGAILSAVWSGNFTAPQNVKHLEIQADDSPNYNMKIHFEKAIKFIEENIQITNVVVHCAAGISRSVCLVIAYMIKTYRIKPQQALEKIRERRQWAGPNEGFMKQLEEYYNEQKFQDQ